MITMNTSFKINNFDEISEPAVTSPVSRKLKATKVAHKREQNKQKHYSGDGKIPREVCTHSAEKNSELCHADKLTPADLELNHDTFMRR